MSALVLILIVLAIVITVLVVVIAGYAIGAAVYYSVLKVVEWLAEHT